MDENECQDCHAALSLDDGKEWPNDVVLCWSCLWNRYEAMEAMLRKIEWTGRMEDTHLPWCPRCGKTEPEGHHKDCSLDALLK